MNYKDTLNLPTTTFPMKANLSQKEKEILKFWNENRIYEKILKKRDRKSLIYFMMALHMQTGIFIWVQVSIRY